jgi:hypothetical protein
MLAGIYAADQIRARRAETTFTKLGKMKASQMNRIENSKGQNCASEHTFACFNWEWCLIGFVGISPFVRVSEYDAL